MDATCTDAHLYSGRLSYFIPRLNPKRLPDMEADSDGRDMNYVYALLDPRTDRVRYIGCSRNPANRLLSHRMSNKKPVGRWLSELAQERIKCKLVILDQHKHLTVAFFIESRLIAEYEAFQGGLLNKMVEYSGRGKTKKRLSLATGRYRQFLLTNALCLYPIEIPAHTVNLAQPRLFPPAPEPQQQTKMFP